jgi:hypothetical protein
MGGGPDGGDCPRSRGIVGGTGDFRNARGEVTAVVVAPSIFDLTYDLD